MAHVAAAAAELRLDHVSIEVPDFADAVGRLDEGLGLRRGVFHLGSATITLIEDGERRAVVLGVASLDMSRAVLSSVPLRSDDEGVAWLDPSATSDLAVGLVEVHDS